MQFFMQNAMVRVPGGCLNNILGALAKHCLMGSGHPPPPALLPMPGPPPLQDTASSVHRRYSTLGVGCRAWGMGRGALGGTDAADVRWARPEAQEHNGAPPDSASGSQAQPREAALGSPATPPPTSPPWRTRGRGGGRVLHGAVWGRGMWSPGEVLHLRRNHSPPKAHLREADGGPGPLGGGR